MTARKPLSKRSKYIVDTDIIKEEKKEKRSLKSRPRPSALGDREEVRSKKRRYVCSNNGGPAPLTHELPPPPKRRRQVTYKEAVEGTLQPVRVYADGVFDIFHPGHARALMQAKNAFPNVHLIAGVTCDQLTHSLKGMTVCSEKERYDALRHCRYVDEVLTDAPWVVTPQFMEQYQIDFVAHDDLPYNTGGSEDIYKPVKEMGRFVAMERTPGISTSDIISRIVRNYDTYLKRNFDKGYTAKDMNVGFIKEKEVRLKENFRGWGEKGKDLVGGFMSLFGRDGRISEFFYGHKEMIKRVFSPAGSPAIEGGAMKQSEGEQSQAPSTPPPSPLRDIGDLLAS